MAKKEKVVNLIEKIDKKKKELKQLKKDLQKAFNVISSNWKEKSAIQFPQLSPCNIGEYVGVDITINGKVYNIFISENRQKLYCMFSLDRKNKEYYGMSIKETMDNADFEKFQVVVNDYIAQNNKQVWQPEFGLVPFFICLLYQPFEFQKMLCCIFNFLTAKFTF